MTPKNPKNLTLRMYSMLLLQIWVLTLFLFPNSYAQSQKDILAEDVTAREFIRKLEKQSQVTKNTFQVPKSKEKSSIKDTKEKNNTPSKGIEIFGGSIPKNKQEFQHSSETKNFVDELSEVENEIKKLTESLDLLQEEISLKTEKSSLYRVLFQNKSLFPVKILSVELNFNGAEVSKSRIFDVLQKGENFPILLGSLKQGSYMVELKIEIEMEGKIREIASSSKVLIESPSASKKFVTTFVLDFQNGKLESETKIENKETDSVFLKKANPYFFSTSLAFLSLQKAQEKKSRSELKFEEGLLSANCSNLNERNIFHCSQKAYQEYPFSNSIEQISKIRRIIDAHINSLQGNCLGSEAQMIGSYLLVNLVSSFELNQNSFNQEDFNRENFNQNNLKQEYQRKGIKNDPKITAIENLLSCTGVEFRSYVEKILQKRNSAEESPEEKLHDQIAQPVVALLEDIVQDVEKKDLRVYEKISLLQNRILQKTIFYNQLAQDWKRLKESKLEPLFVSRTISIAKQLLDLGETEVREDSFRRGYSPRRVVSNFVYQVENIEEARRKLSNLLVLQISNALAFAQCSVERCSHNWSQFTIYDRQAAELLMALKYKYEAFEPTESRTKPFWKLNSSHFDTVNDAGMLASHSSPREQLEETFLSIKQSSEKLTLLRARMAGIKVEKNIGTNILAEIEGVEKKLLKVSANYFPKLVENVSHLGASQRFLRVAKNVEESCLSAEISAAKLDSERCESFKKIREVGEQLNGYNAIGLQIWQREIQQAGFFLNSPSMFLEHLLRKHFRAFEVAFEIELSALDSQLKSWDILSRSADFLAKLNELDSAKNDVKSRSWFQSKIQDALERKENLR